MTINVRTKGQSGEREIAKTLNDIIASVRAERELPQYAVNDELFQRNQNQSAVGGSDLSCPFPLEIEIKRQEALSINSWWKQCQASAARTNGIPILIFRQNRKAWRVCMLVDVPLQPTGYSCYSSLGSVRGELTMESFQNWFREYYKATLNNGAWDRAK